MPITIVIGTGISAAAYLLSVKQYLKSVSQTLGTVGVVGGADLWQKMSHAHAMGQPAQLLTGNLLGHGREDRGFTPPQLSERGFLTAGQFSRTIQHYLTQHSCAQLPDSYVSRITKEGSKYLLTTHVEGEIGGIITCDRVIFAPGPGPARPLATEAGVMSEEEIASFGGRIIKGNDFMSPDWRTPLSLPPEKTTVAVYGGSATAAWAVELADMRKMDVICWFTRPGRDKDAWNAKVRFNEAFPAGDRNNTVEEVYEARRHVYKLKKVENVESSTKIRLTFERQDGHDVVTYVDLLIYALGAEHTLTQGVRGVLAPDLIDSLVAFYDRNRAISSTPSLLAIGTEDRSLMVVGSAMSSAGGFGGSALQVHGDEGRLISTLAAYREINKTLPDAAKPPEGIAMVMAGIEALNEYVPASPVRGGRKAVFITPRLTTSERKDLPRGSANPDANHISSHDIDFEWDINFNTSNRTQLAIYIAQTTDLSPFAANLAVALIVYFRTRPENVRGLSDPQVATIINCANLIYKRLAELNHDLDAQLLHFDKKWGTEQHIVNCVGYVTTTTEWKLFWRNKGISLT